VLCGKIGEGQQADSSTPSKRARGGYAGEAHGLALTAYRLQDMISGHYQNLPPGLRWAFFWLD
jgi:hypothetical protein